MRVRRIEAKVEHVRECCSPAGKVYRTEYKTIDVTHTVLALSLEAIRALGDTNTASLRLMKPMVEGDLVEVTILQSILDHFGVSRLKEINQTDLRMARELTGLVRRRVRPQPALAAAA